MKNRKRKFYLGVNSLLLILLIFGSLACHKKSSYDNHSMIAYTSNYIVGIDQENKEYSIEIISKRNRKNRNLFVPNTSSYKYEDKYYIKPNPMAKSDISLERIDKKGNIEKITVLEHGDPTITAFDYENGNFYAINDHLYNMRIDVYDKDCQLIKSKDFINDTEEDVRIAPMSVAFNNNHIYILTKVIHNFSNPNAPSKTYLLQFDKDLNYIKDYLIEEGEGTYFSLLNKNDKFYIIKTLKGLIEEGIYEGANELLVFDPITGEIIEEECLNLDNTDGMYLYDIPEDPNHIIIQHYQPGNPVNENFYSICDLQTGQEKILEVDPSLFDNGMVSGLGNFSQDKDHLYLAHDSFLFVYDKEGNTTAALNLKDYDKKLEDEIFRFLIPQNTN